MDTRTIEADPMQGTMEAPVAAQDVAVREDAPSPAVAPGVVLDAIVALAKDPTVDVAKLDALMQMQERMEDRQAERAFAAALAACQAEIPQVARDGTVSLGEGKGSYAFARYEDIDRVLRPIYSKHGFSIGFDRVRDADRITVTGTLAHCQGHHRTASFNLPLDSGPGRNNLQAAGSSDSYGKRYIIEGFFNIVRKGKDDDGVAGGEKPVSFEEAAAIKKLVDESGIGDGMDDAGRKTAIIEWFNDMLGYALPKGYASIRQEDSTRIRRTLLSLKAKRLTSKEEGLKL